MRLRHLLVPIAAAASAVAGAPAHAATVLDTTPLPTRVAAWNGTVAWSAFDAQANAWRLVFSTNGAAPVAAPVAPSPAPFDVDLGTNRNGSTYAVYTRCATPPANQAINARGTGCDIYRLGVATGREEHLTATVVPHARRARPDDLPRRDRLPARRAPRRPPGQHPARRRHHLRRTRHPRPGQDQHRLAARPRADLRPRRLRRLVARRPRLRPPGGPRPHAERPQRPQRLPGGLRRRQRGRHLGPVAGDRQPPRVRLGAHQRRLGPRQPDRPLRRRRPASHLRARVQPLPLRRRRRRRHRHRRQLRELRRRPDVGGRPARPPGVPRDPVAGRDASTERVGFG